MTDYIVTITLPNGYVFNHKVPASGLREFLANAAQVLGVGETLTFTRAD